MTGLLCLIDRCFKMQDHKIGYILPDVMDYQNGCQLHTVHTFTWPFNKSKITVCSAVVMSSIPKDWAVRRSNRSVISQGDLWQTIDLNPAYNVPIKIYGHRCLKSVIYIIQMEAHCVQFDLGYNHIIQSGNEIPLSVVQPHLEYCI